MVIDGGFRLDRGRYRQLEQHARRLGFGDLRTCLQALSDAGYRVPRLADQLDTSHWLVSRALTDLGVRLQPRQERLTQQRQRAAEERVAARVAELGFGDVEVYLMDRVAERGWLLSAVVAELGAALVTVRRLLERYGVHRSQRTTGEQAASVRGRTTQARVWQALRTARLAELGLWIWRPICGCG